ncbi:MAG: alpha/beta fold hydrolase [Gammaproteobacteria bacterium]|nr:alpha/beta fold hydrolase [Gammaproteobacteria bacterium]
MNAERLAHFLATLDTDTVHLVGHSLGGILIRALFHYSPPRQPGRIVTLGAPHGGSRVAQHLNRHAFWRWAMGKGVAQLLAGAPREWSSPSREMGVICGTHSLGLGRLLYRGLPRPNDGLLTVKESAYPAAREHLALPLSHTGMLFSRALARQVAAFLEAGQFTR